MVVLPVFDELTIESHKGRYTACLNETAFEDLCAMDSDSLHFIVDDHVAEVYRDELAGVLHSPSVVLVTAEENNKSLEKMPVFVEQLITQNVRRDHTLIAIGGGIIQDITCFLSATLLRGIDWAFYPTTLLAQADSCIGSKSSINAGTAKNILGTFTPPRRVTIDTRFLSTLSDRDLRSGIGEIIKVHIIDGPKSFADIAGNFDRLFTDPAVLQRHIHHALMVKKRYIEEDEFDQGPRNIFNYGHSFGHAIEAATEFAVPHGIAVTIGMDMANWISAQFGVGTLDHYHRMSPTLRTNAAEFNAVPVPIEPFLAALAKDKKNVGQGTVSLILPDRDARVFKGVYDNDGRFHDLCSNYFNEVRTT